MNFEFVKQCEPDSPILQGMYGEIAEELERAEQCYWTNPQECGMILRGTAEKVCRVYNTYYEVGCPEEYLLEQFLCYTDDDGHNALVSRFLSVVRKEQRDRLNKLRVLGDDCILGEKAPDKGMTFADRMSQNARRMMDTMMEVLKDMCEKINKRNDLQDRVFLEKSLPGQLEQEVQEEGAEKEKKSWFRRIFS